MAGDDDPLGSTDKTTLSSVDAPGPTQENLKDLANIVKVVNGYKATCSLRIEAHNEKADKYHKKNLYLGVPAAVIAAVVGSSIFATLSAEKNIYLMVMTGSLSILAAILSALQTFLKYSEMAQVHKAAEDGYVSLRRRIEFFMLKLSASRPPLLSDAQKELQDIVNELNRLGKSSPIVSHKSIISAVNAAEEHGSAINRASSGNIVTSYKEDIKF